MDTRLMKFRKWFVSIFHNRYSAWIILFISLNFTLVAWLLSNRISLQMAQSRFDLRSHKLSVKQYLEELIRNLMATYSQKDNRVNAEVSIPDDELDLDKVLILGLLVNEIISNSLKHAFKDINDPNIKVCSENVEGFYYLEISDNGKGMTIEKFDQMHESFGLMLIKVFSNQLKGELSIDAKPGTKYKIKFAQNG